MGDLCHVDEDSDLMVSGCNGSLLDHALFGAGETHLFFAFDVDAFVSPSGGRSGSGVVFGAGSPQRRFEC